MTFCYSSKKSFYYESFNLLVLTPSFSAFVAYIDMLSLHVLEDPEAQRALSCRRHPRLYNLFPFARCRIVGKTSSRLPIVSSYVSCYQSRFRNQERFAALSAYRGHLLCALVSRRNLISRRSAKAVFSRMRSTFV